MKSMRPRTMSSRPQRSPRPKGAETVVPEDVVPAHCASTKSAPQRSGDPGPSGTTPPPCGLNEVRSPMERRHGPRTVPRTRRRSRCLNEVRSPKERRLVAGVRDLVLALASTKSAPQRSGDRDIHPLAFSTPQRSPLPQRSGDRSRRHDGTLGNGASTKSAPQRSGDWSRCTTVTVRACLNEFRSPKERRLGISDWAGRRFMPQRSPLPKGAETGAVRLGWEKVSQTPQRSPLPKGAETSGLTHAAEYMAQPQRSPLPEGAETAPQITAL